MKALNLGCGNRFHPAWVNIDFVPTNPNVIFCNLNQGIPFTDCSFDSVYHSHVLEHLSKDQAPFFIKECYRVLRPKGILRIVVPDLEQIARTYLTTLEQARLYPCEWNNDYEWMMLELYDQTVRNKSGGAMVDYLSRTDLRNEKFVINRCGAEIKNLIQSLRKQNIQPLVTSHEGKLKRILKHIYLFFSSQTYRYEELLKFILKKDEYKILQMARFRQSGEVHQWMYDTYSLSKLLNQAGFCQVKQYSAFESYISEWSKFNLDTEPDNTIYKPDSLYMEGIKQP